MIIWSAIWNTQNSIWRKKTYFWVELELSTLKLIINMEVLVRYIYTNPLSVDFQSGLRYRNAILSYKHIQNYI